MFLFFLFFIVSMSRRFEKANEP